MPHQLPTGHSRALLWAMVPKEQSTAPIPPAFLQVLDHQHNRAHTMAVGQIDRTQAARPQHRAPAHNRIKQAGSSLVQGLQQSHTLDAMLSGCSSHKTQTKMQQHAHAACCQANKQPALACWSNRCSFVPMETPVMAQGHPLHARICAASLHCAEVVHKSLCVRTESATDLAPLAPVLVGTMLHCWQHESQCAFAVPSKPVELKSPPVRCWNRIITQVSFQRFIFVLTMAFPKQPGWHMCCTAV